MKHFVLAGLVFFVVTGAVFAQTATPGASIYATLTSGQTTRFDYNITASDVQIANLLTLILLSAWAFFFMGMFVFIRSRK